MNLENQEIEVYLIGNFHEDIKTESETFLKKGFPPPSPSLPKTFDLFKEGEPYCFQKAEVSHTGGGK